MTKGGARFFLATSLVALAAAAQGNETISYDYDSLGRLVRVDRSGTVNNGVNAAYCYDSADNRTSVTVGQAAATQCPTYAPPPAPGPVPPPPEPVPPPPEPVPPPPAPAPVPPSPPPSPPPSSNLAPTPVNDTGVQGKCTTRAYDVVANDADPDGNYPLTLVSVTGIGFVLASPTTIEFSALSNGRTGTYTVRDSLGATATATLTVSLAGGTCTPREPLQTPVQEPEMVQ